MKREIILLIPDIEPEQNIEIDVRINGRKKTLQYRVELLNWEGNENESRVATIKHKLNDYDKNWELVEVGAPTGKDIPLIFRKLNKDEGKQK